ncbi:MAG: thioredoxin domain-containing protein [Cryomorphaceae bacterium]|nr:MAG: thioredoxin domain-containing protein [Cryomorphaceae bacterium]
MLIKLRWLNLLVLASFFSCSPQTDSMKHDKQPNRLANESSPYLLQHAYNPVDWYPWGEEAFEKARKENKLVLISIGYSACHWCHVMERESFENDTLAAIMNEHFVSVKVDREERPDVDQIYMNAVQLMTGSGGWPLNCFTLPDGRPVYGGTYFPPAQWEKILITLHETWQQEPEKFAEYAQKLTEGVQQSDLVQLQEDEAWLSRDTLDLAVRKWKDSFDEIAGGPNRAPKFPLPNNYQFLLNYGFLAGDEKVSAHVKLTLNKMAMGGIYDQVGGGFARYSVDMVWKVPHFEKMLYDNGQLLSLYSLAYRRYRDPLHKHVVYQTAEWLEREMTAANGAFYSALDADSEGEEGKFYVWKEDELKELFGDDFPFVKDLYSIGGTALWEHGNNIPLRKKTDEELMQIHKLTPEELLAKQGEVNKTLLAAREKRVRPGLDDKTLTSWNALTVSGLCEAYLTFGDERFLEPARKNMDFLLSAQRRSDGGLNHSYKDGKSTINGYLEDYCFTIEALLDLYRATFEEQWLETARELTDYTIAHFSQEETGMFYFTSDLDPPLIARKTEVSDNVIPSSNSVMARVLFLQGHLWFNEAYLERSRQMLRNVAPMIPKYASGYSNWANLMLGEVYNWREVVITGDEAITLALELQSNFTPNVSVLAAKHESELPLFESRFFENQTTIFVCENRACQMPVNEVAAALKQLRW